MATKRRVDYAKGLDRLDHLSAGTAAAVAGPAPISLNDRLKAAERLEGERSHSPLAIVVSRQQREEGSRILDLPLDEGFVTYRPGMAVRAGARYAIPIGLIAPNPLNPRAFYFDEDLKDRSISLATEGQLQAIQVYPPDEHGIFGLHDGETRWRSLALVGRATVNAEVVERDDNPLVRFKQARALNSERKSQTVFDDAVRFSDLLNQGVVSQNSELATAFNLSPGYVSKVLSIGQMPKRLLETMARSAECFGLANAYATYQHWDGLQRDDAEAEKLIAKIAESKLSVREVQRLVDAKATHSAVESAPRRRQLPLSRAEIKTGAKGELKAFPDGKLQMHLSGIPEANRAVLFNRLLALFDECGLKYEAVGAG